MRLWQVLTGVRKWVGKMTRPLRKRRWRGSSIRLGIEWLEDRTNPSSLFWPEFGASPPLSKPDDFYSPAITANVRTIDAAVRIDAGAGYGATPPRQLVIIDSATPNY